MRKQGHEAYLETDEELASDYPNPIDLTNFDLHGERSRADAAVEQLEADLAAGIVSGPGPQEALQRARAKSFVTRAIAKEWATEVAVETATADLDQELRDLTQ